jgi:hypothetical protein
MLNELGERLSPGAGLHVEFKADSLEKLRRGEVSMFSYDLVSAHRKLHGEEDLFAGCEHHLDATKIPLAEATRLLFNRSTGLLLCKELLRKGERSAGSSDFIARNIAKAQLAFGDVLLTCERQYHWSCLERHARLQRLRPSDPPEWLEQIREHHSAGVDFKLHPGRGAGTQQDLEENYACAASLALRIWLWLEERRLGQPFPSPADYAFSSIKKCPNTSGLRNALLNIRTFGAGATLDRRIMRYPRERLFHALSLLLWERDVAQEPSAIRRLQQELRTRATDWQELMAVYKQVWATYG